MNTAGNINLKCGNCESHTFIIDYDRTGYKQTQPNKPIKINGVTEFSLETYFKCSECGWQLSMPISNYPPPSITLTFEIQKQKK